MPDLRNNLDLVYKVHFFVNTTQNIQHTITCSSHMQYQAFRLQTGSVPETRTNYSLTVRGPSHCSSYIFPKTFILLNSRLNELSVESNNARIRVWTRKLIPSKVDTADSQGCEEIWAHPRLSFSSGFYCPETQCSVSDSPKTL